MAILFSGGLDCTLLARLVDDILPHEQTIDLLNVAFENPRVIQTALDRQDCAFLNGTPYDLCPDRVTGLSSARELRRVCPHRQWRFVSIDVPFKEFKFHRSEVVSLMQPHNTEMDLSIACALYFASRGTGHLEDQQKQKYKTPARVLLSGLGADELFAGYTRHATAFLRKGYQGLIDELSLDFSRLGKRNLGRDDRVISHWGKEARYPYLDEDLLDWALQLPVWEKCGFREPHTISNAIVESSAEKPNEKLDSGKRLLRLLAWKKGLVKVALEKKRAIQFGARTAKMESGKTKGNQVLREGRPEVVDEA